MARIFISYKRVDKDVVFPLKDRIEKALGEPCWIDLSGIESDAQFASVIINNIDEAEVFLFMYSKTHGNIKDFEKDWTIREINYAQEENKRIVFVNLDDTPLTKWFKFMFPRKEQVSVSSVDAVNALISDLKKWLQPQANQLDKKIDTYAILMHVDETCELYINGAKNCKIKGGKQRIVDGLLPKKTYHLTFKSLAHNGLNIEIDYSQDNPSPNQQFDINISFSEHLQKEEKLKKEQQIELRKEKEKNREREGLLKQALAGYDDHGELRNGFAIVDKNGKLGFVNESGFENIPCIYDNVSEFNNGFATVCLNNKWGIIDEYGQLVVDLKSDCPCWQSGGYKYFVFKENGHYAITTFKKGIPTSFPYLDISLIDGYEDLIWVRDDKGWQIISMTDTPSPFTMIVNDIMTSYDSPRNNNVWFNSRNIRMKTCWLPMRVQSIQSRRWGYLNNKLKLTIPFVDELSDEHVYENNLEIIKTNNKMGLANVDQGSFVIPCMHERVKQMFYRYDIPFFLIGDNLLQNSYHPWGGIQGVVNPTGDIIVPQQYQHIFYLQNEEGEIIYFGALLAPQMRLDGNNISGYESNSELHVYDFDGNLLKKMPYDENVNIKGFNL